MRKNLLIVLFAVLPMAVWPQADLGGIEWAEFISNPKECVINTDVYPTENTWFEIKMDFGDNPDFWMGWWDLTKHPDRIVSRFFIYENNLFYD